MTDRRSEIESEPPPLFAGLSVDGRRAVNLAVIAYAELLHERLAAMGLSDFARQSTLRRVYETSYGGQDECIALMQRASRGITDLERMKDDLAAIKGRTDRLRRSASYRGVEEVIPAQDSLDSAAPVLLEEYWDVYKALVR